MSDVVASGIIEASKLEAWAKTFHSKGTGQDSPLLYEIKANFSEDGISVTATDPSTASAFYGTTLRPMGFEHYESPGRVTIGLSLEKIIDRLGPAANDQPVEFEVDMETRKLILRYGTTEWKLSTIDPESIRSEPDEPDLDLDCQFTLTGAQIKHAVEVASMVSDHIDVRGRPDERAIIFAGQGDTDEVTDEYGDEEVVDASIPERVDGRYSAGFLDALTKPVPDDAEVDFRFTEEMPMRLDWDAFDGALEVHQMVAPRIKSS